MGELARIFLTFLRLGCTSFGGPVAHLGYFQTEFVERRQWLTHERFAELLALAQSLPGPASSQTGYAIGVTRAGLAGGVAAWLGFTLPSAVLMAAFALGYGQLHGRVALGVLHGLQLVAVAVVAQAVLTMQRRLAPDRVRLALAAVAVAIVLAGPATLATSAVILMGALVGLAGFRQAARAEDAGAMHEEPGGLSRRTGAVAAMLFAGTLAVSLWAAQHGAFAARLFGSLFRTGSLVFGGGHVVLPLLESVAVGQGWMTPQAFLAGYGAAQALPGPLFAFAAYVGAAAGPAEHRLLDGGVALAAIFLPGMLLMTAILPYWSILRERVAVRAALRGVNAAVVGVLMAALYRPVWTSTVHTAMDFCIALGAFLLLTVWRVAPWIIVALVAGCAAAQAVWFPALMR